MFSIDKFKAIFNKKRLLRLLRKLDPRRLFRVPKGAKHRGLRIILRIVIALFLAGVISLGVLIGITAHRVGPIDPQNIYESIDQTSYMYDSGGEQIAVLHYEEDRKIVSIHAMPENLKNAFIAIEDKTFYKHHGFNFRRMIGAVWSSITSKSEISGTSTITQQLARNVYLSDIKGQRSLSRKFSEMYIAWRIEHTLTKDEILEAYLNTIYLGYGNYGVDAAAKTYFSKSLKDLDLTECAALAALPQAPDTYALITSEPGEDTEPIEEVQYYSGELPDEEDQEQEDDQADQYGQSGYSDGDGTEEGDGTVETGLYSSDISRPRRELVLDLMVEQGYAGKTEADSAKGPIADHIHPSFRETDPTYTYFSDYVSDQVISDLMTQYDMSEEEARRMVYTGGLKIHTTIDSTVQEIICAEFENDYNFPRTVDGSEVQASMVITEVGTGKIIAMSGGRKASGARLFNRALSPRQPGSSIKPLSVYGAALQRSYELASEGKPYPFVDYGMDRQGIQRWGDYITAGSIVVDEPLTFNNEQWPQNVTRHFSGWNTLRTALQQSINTCAVKVLLQVGTDYSIDMLHRFGITTVADDESQPVSDVNPAALALGAMTYGVTPLEMSLAYAAFPNGGVRNTPVCYTQVYDRKGRTILVGHSDTMKVMDSGVAWIMTDLLKSVVSRGGGGAAYVYGAQVGGKTGTTNDRYDIWFDGFTPRYSASLWVGTDKNVEMTSGSWMAARLWSRIMRQIPDIREGEYREMPSNVVVQRGEYYTSGTEPSGGYNNNYNRYNRNNGYGRGNYETEEVTEEIERTTQ